MLLIIVYELYFEFLIIWWLFNHIIILIIIIIISTAVDLSEPEYKMKSYTWTKKLFQLGLVKLQLRFPACLLISLFIRFILLVSRSRILDEKKDAAFNTCNRELRNIQVQLFGEISSPCFESDIPYISISLRCNLLKITNRCFPRFNSLFQLEA
jgi:hypothetical protein